MGSTGRQVDLKATWDMLTGRCRNAASTCHLAPVTYWVEQDSAGKQQIITEVESKFNELMAANTPVAGAPCC